MTWVTTGLIAGLVCFFFYLILSKRKPKAPTVAEGLAQESRVNAHKVQALQDERLKKVNAYAGKLLADCRQAAKDGYRSYSVQLERPFDDWSEYIAKDLRRKGFCVRVRSFNREHIRIEW